MSALKEFVEIETLKKMSYEEINEFINKLNSLVEAEKQRAVGLVDALTRYHNQEEARIKQALELDGGSYEFLKNYDVRTFAGEAIKSYKAGE